MSGLVVGLGLLGLAGGCILEQEDEEEGVGQVGQEANVPCQTTTETSQCISACWNALGGPEDEDWDAADECYNTCYNYPMCPEE